MTIAQCMDRENILFAAHQLFGTTANWWETYCNTHTDVDSITWNEFKARFRNHYVPHGTMKLKKKEFTDLKQGGMTVSEYFNSFIQLSRYAPDDVNTDEKKHDVFLNGLNDDIQFQLLNTDYANFQHMVDKAVVIENKIKEMEKDGKRKVSFNGQPFGSNVRPHFSQPNLFFKSPQMNQSLMPVQVPRP
jgi:predicted PolB exonuclease-like 3'-5' exonuclease